MTDTTFTTRDGRLWTAAFTAETESAAFEAFRLRLAELANRRPAQLIERFMKHLDHLAGLLYLAAHGQLVAAGVSPEAFAQMIRPEHVPGAAVALMGAIAARYPAGSLARHMTAANRK